MAAGVAVAAAALVGLLQMQELNFPGGAQRWKLAGHAFPEGEAPARITQHL